MEALKRALKKNPDKLKLLTELIETSVDGSRDIFVNRPLNMAGVRYLGFDMDYTLAIYNKQAIEELAYRKTLEKLVALRHYPEHILTLPYEVDHIIRGLLIDHRKGNLLKINRFKQVGRVQHGNQKLETNIYFNDKINQSDMQRFSSVDTLFSLPEAYLYSLMVDLAEADQLPTKDFTRIFEDIRFCIDLTHKDGSLKQEIIQDVGRYVFKDPHLPLTLDKFKDSGKKLFLLTNSEWFYTDIVMHYLLSGDALEYASWRDYFDIVVVNSRKPDFFKGSSPFQVVDPETHELSLMEGEHFEPGVIYSGGNFKTFEGLIEAQGNEVLYVGDHIFGDVLRSGKDSNWRTVLVIQELEEELAKTALLQEKNQRLYRLGNKRDKLYYELHMHSSQLRSLRELQAQTDLEFNDNERQILEKTLTDLEDNIAITQKEINRAHRKLQALRDEIDATYHPRWGPLFHEGDEISRFGDQVRDYACLYTSRVSNFFFYPTDRYFKSLRDIMPHDRWIELAH